MNTPENKEKLSIESFKQVNADTYYEAGQEAKSHNGEAVSDDGFKLVQQDKSIHDVKFTTKPTTFFKDAMHRFSKNHSSVVGGIILGLLFLLAIILPINGVLPYEAGPDTALNYEINLAPKIFAAGTGFWDGTITSKSVAYPYEEQADGSLVYTGTYADPNVVVKVSNKHTAFSDLASSDATGGYAWVIQDASAQTSEVCYFVSYQYNYDLTNTYMVSYTLGNRTLDGYATPEYALFVISGDNYVALTDWTSDYGDQGSLEEDGQTVAPYTTKTLDLTKLFKAATAFKGLSTISQARVGLAIHPNASQKTSLYVKDFTLKSSKVSETKQMANRSFTDANTAVMQPQKNKDDTYNTSYWATNSSKQLTTADARTLRCDIVYDAYLITYGLRSGMQVQTTTLNKWQANGLISGWDSSNPTFGELTLTDAGKADTSVYVTKVDSKINDDSYSCTIMMWKYLGYKKMPVHVFGTDSKGRDMLKYVFLGLRTSLLLGIIVSAINILIGVIWGSISGYFGGTVDIVMERIVDILNGIPWIVLMTVLILKMGSNFQTFALSLCLTGWIGTEAITRSQFYRYRDREYVLAARTLGAKSPRLIFRHILPNAIGTIVTSSILMIPSVIFSEATISYLGLGLKNLSSLGVILSDAQGNISNYPYQLLLPAIIISLLMICFNLFGNGLRDAFNPSLKGTD